MLVFVEGGKPENPEKNPWRKAKNQQQTQPMYDAGYGFQANLVGGKCSHHCAIPTPQKKKYKENNFIPCCPVSFIKEALH